MFSNINSYKKKHYKYKFNKKSNKNRNKNFSNIKIIMYAFVFALFFRIFFFDNFHVPSGSMKPTLLVGDKIIVSKMSYGYSKYSIPFGIIPFEGRIFEKTPERGDIVVFKFPGNTRINYVKRLIGLPGDIIQMIDGKLFINKQAAVSLKIGQFLDNISDEDLDSVLVDQYIETLPNGATYSTIDYYDGFFYDNTKEFIVPENYYFFMGDNRDNSQDSRTTHLGFVHKDLLIGKVKRILISSEYSLFNIFRYNKIRFDRMFFNPYIREGIEAEKTASISNTAVSKSQSDIIKIESNKNVIKNNSSLNTSDNNLIINAKENEIKQDSSENLSQNNQVNQGNQEDIANPMQPLQDIQPLLNENQNISIKKHSQRRKNRKTEESMENNDEVKNPDFTEMHDLY